MRLNWEEYIHDRSVEREAFGGSFSTDGMEGSPEASRVKAEAG